MKKTNLTVIVTIETTESMSYAKVLERHGAKILYPGKPEAPSKEMREFMSNPGPYVLTRPYIQNAHGIFALKSMHDVEGLHPMNLGLMISKAKYAVPAICEVIDECLAPTNCTDVVVIGHGLGAVIAAHLIRAHKVSVSLVTRDHWLSMMKNSTVSSDTQVINASRAEVHGPSDRILQLPLNPPEFSRKLIEKVLERAERIF